MSVTFSRFNNKQLIIKRIQLHIIKIPRFAIIIFFFGFLFCCCKVHSQSRQKISINSGWEFYKVEPSTGDIAETKPVNLPHTWNVEDSLDDIPGYYRDKGQYTKTLFVPDSWRFKKVYLFFEGANQTATLSINDKKVGQHVGGYTAFRFDISEFVHFGRANKIHIEVDNSHDENIPPLDADFTFFGGIYRDVFVEVVNPVHFDMNNMASDGVFITTPEISANWASVHIKGKLSNDGDSKQKILVRASILDATGKEVVMSMEPNTLKSDESKDFEMDNMVVSNPKLWSPRTPYLYTAKIQILSRDSEKILDEIVSPVGFRWYGFNDQNQFMLNGSPLFLKGINRHQDYIGIGNAVPNELHVRDMKLIKEMGANFVRLAHYPQDPAVLEACDVLGLIVWEEIPIVNEITTSQEFRENSIQMLKEMLRQHYNHPSLVMVGYMNEVLIGLRKNDKTPEEVETYVPKVKELSDILNGVAKQEAPERISVIAFNNRLKRYRNAGMVNTTDLVGWNIYNGWYGGNFEGFGNRVDQIFGEYPNVPLIVSEYGAGSDPRIHSSQPIRFDFSAEYGQLYHNEILTQIGERANIAGVAIWCFADFASESRKDAVPHINNKGVMAYDRSPKDVYYLYKSRWKSEPMVHIAVADWTIQAGMENNLNGSSTKEIMLYSNLFEVELFHNGKSLGVKKVEDYQVHWKVPFRNGKNTLKAFASSEKGLVIEDYASIDFDLIPNNLKKMQNQKKIHINLGAHFSFIDKSTKSVYLPDQPYQEGGFGYIGGEAYMMGDWRIGANKNIEGTSSDPIYQTQRIGLDAYKFDVPLGKYELTLNFANLENENKTTDLINDLSLDENLKEKAISSVFDISINGSKLIEGFEFGKLKEATNLQTEVFVNTDSGILIEFNLLKGRTALNAISLKRKL